MRSGLVSLAGGTCARLCPFTLGRPLCIRLSSVRAETGPLWAEASSRARGLVSLLVWMLVPDFGTAQLTNWLHGKEPVFF